MQKLLELAAAHQGIAEFAVLAIMALAFVAIASGGKR